MMRQCLTIVLIVHCCNAFPQQSTASREFFSGLQDCSASLGGWKCLELDLSSEASIENDSLKVYTYSWNFGDGNRKTGTRIEHCYEDFGSYQVTMDLIDTETNTVIRNEMSSTVGIYEEIYPVITATNEGLPPSFMAFTCTYDHGEQFTPDRVFWRVDGAYYEGSSIVHSFPVAGNYLVEMAVEKDTDFFGAISACSQTEITIDDSDIWTLPIANFIRRTREKTEAGPFTATEAICFVRPLSGAGKDHIFPIPLSRLMTDVTLAEDEHYEIMLAAGNLFSERKQISMVGIKGNDLYLGLRDSVTAFLRNPLTFLPPVRFNMNQVSEVADASALEQTADLLLKHRSMQVEIGSYLHTGSRNVKGIAMSLKRSRAVKALLIQYGVAANRITIASPEYNGSLMNTCSAVTDCGHESAMLNGMVEFKITGTSL